MTTTIEIKFVEVRDKGTFIPCMALRVQLAGSPSETPTDYLMWRAGGGYSPVVYFGSLHGGRPFNHDCYAWRDRTYSVAHQWIEKNWGSLVDGQVVDVEYILRETPEPKISERYTEDTQ